LPMGQFVLSYVITTYNKLNYLQTVLSDLISARREDEEILVIDGGSTDGTGDYLRRLFESQKIQYFLSERDFGEGHGFNKGLMAARGELIKLLSDDDIYDFNVIDKCRRFMESKKDVDYVNTHGGWYDLNVQNDIFVFTNLYIDMMNIWITKGIPFACCMLGMMIRKSSLPLLGFFNPSIKRADAEYSLRITSQKIKMAWCTGIGYVRVLNDDSNSSSYKARILEETKRLNVFYNVDMDGKNSDKGKDLLFRKIKTNFKSLFISGKAPTQSQTPKANADFGVAFTKAKEWLDLINGTTESVFLSN
jgi:glycosyltransferase involved in cell wall biosynthesis